MQTHPLGTPGIFWAVPLRSFPATCRLKGPVTERCHHVTFGRGPLLPEWQSAIGWTHLVRVVSDCWSHELGVQAYAVRLPDVFASLTRTTRAQQALGPVTRHITLFTAEGVSAFTSNEMFAGRFEQAPPPVTHLSLRLGFCAESDIDDAKHTSYRLQTA